MDFTIEVNGSKRRASANVWALALYEAEFAVNGVGADMLKDVFGKASSTDEEGTLDFTKTNWTSLCKAAWACEKAADDSVPPFHMWARQVSDMPLFDISESLSIALSESFFRLGAARKTQPEEA